MAGEYLVFDDPIVGRCAVVSLELICFVISGGCGGGGGCGG